MASSNNPFARIDWLLFLPVLILLIIGELFIYSSGISSRGVLVSNEYLKQIIWMSFGFVLLTIFSLIRYEIYRDFAIPAFIGLALLVVVTAFVGKTVNGARNWIGVGDLGVQPSEFLKIAAILSFGLLVERFRDRLGQLRYYLLLAGAISVPMGIILIQQDLGTSLVFIPIFIFSMIAAGASWRHIIYTVLFGTCTIVFVFVPSWYHLIKNTSDPAVAIFFNQTVSLVFFGTLSAIALLGVVGMLLFKRQYFYVVAYVFSIPVLAWIVSLGMRAVLKDYQLKRLLVFIDPYFDSKGAGWNVIQSLTAVGSGGLTGKGFLQGTQSHLQFLPEQSTDFIFSIISEETGFLGTGLILVCYVVILARLLWIASKAKDSFGAMVCIGVAGMLFTHILINIGMTIGVMPVTGIPLPFVSYGGSALWSMFIATGIVMSINSYRFQF